MECDVTGCDNYKSHIISIGGTKFGICSECITGARKVVIDFSHAMIDFIEGWEKKILNLPVAKKPE